MLRRLPLAAAVLTMMTASPLVPAAASAATTPACSGVVSITALAFSPPSVSPGQGSVAGLTAQNCTGQSLQAQVLWYGRFTGPGGGIPPGCPVLDPVVFPANFAPYGGYSYNFGFSTFTWCSATGLTVTVSIRGQDGSLLAQGTANLVIAPPPAAGPARA